MSTVLLYIWFKAASSYLENMHKAKCIKQTYNRRSVLFISYFGGSTCNLWGKCSIGSCEFSI